MLRWRSPATATPLSLGTSQRGQGSSTASQRRAQDPVRGGGEGGREGGKEGRDRGKGGVVEKERV